MQWFDCDKAGHEEGCFYAVANNGVRLYDCEEGK